MDLINLGIYCPKLLCPMLYLHSPTHAPTTWFELHGIITNINLFSLNELSTRRELSWVVYLFITDNRFMDWVVPRAHIIYLITCKHWFSNDTMKLAVHLSVPILLPSPPPDLQSSSFDSYAIWKQEDNLKH